MLNRRVQKVRGPDDEPEPPVLPPEELFKSFGTLARAGEATVQDLKALLDLLPDKTTIATYWAGTATRHPYESTLRFEVTGTKIKMIMDAST